METRTCFNCAHRGREQTGPHAFDHFCQLKKPDFPSIGQCRFHAPGESMDDETDWPYRVKEEPRATYFTGVTNNQVGHDFEVRQVGDLIRIGNTEFTAVDAEEIARRICHLTWPLLSTIERESA